MGLIDGQAGGHTRRIFLAATAALLSAAPVKSRLSAASFVPKAGNSIRWLAFYGATADESVLATYDIVVLDSAFQGSISRVADAGARVCGYLSLGEIRTSDSLLMYLDPAWLCCRRILTGREPVVSTSEIHHGVRSLLTGGSRRSYRKASLV